MIFIKNTNQNINLKRFKSLPCITLYHCTSVILFMYTPRCNRVRLNPPSGPARVLVKHAFLFHVVVTRPMSLLLLP